MASVGFRRDGDVEVFLHVRREPLGGRGTERGVFPEDGGRTFADEVFVRTENLLSGGALADLGIHLSGCVAPSLDDLGRRVSLEVPGLRQRHAYGHESLPGFVASTR